MTILNQEVMQRPERRRREGRSSARFAFAWRSSLFCVPVLFLYLCLLWVYVFYGFCVRSAKLQCGATPPSVMVLFFSNLLLSLLFFSCAYSFWQKTTQGLSNMFPTYNGKVQLRSQWPIDLICLLWIDIFQLGEFTNIVSGMTSSLIFVMCAIDYES